jgi:hypothetical protein
MQENVGSLDRWVRLAAGGALMFGAARALGARGALAPALVFASGAMVLQTAVTRVCALNALLGIDTRSSSTRSAGPALGSAGSLERAASDIGAAQRLPADS